MNVEKRRFTKLTQISLAKSVLNGLKKVNLCVARYYLQQCFLLYDDFCKFLKITKNYLIDSLSIYDLIVKIFTH